MKRNKKLGVIALFSAAVLCVSLTACESEDVQIMDEAAAEESRIAAESAAEESRIAAEAVAEEKRRAEIEQKIIEILEWTPAVDGFSLNLATAITRTFHQYKWNFDAYNGSKTVFKVTFTGNFSPNPRDLPQLSQSGTISWLVDIQNSTVTLWEDPNDISSAFILLALPY